MPINESGGKARERWPLSFDLEGIPRNSAERSKLLEQQRNLEQLQETDDMAVPVRGQTRTVPNQFAGSKPQETIIDINNPPHRNFNPHAPENEFPKMLFHHDTGKVLTVNSAKEEKIATEKHGFQLKPAPDRNYHGARSGMIAPVKPVAEPREEEMIASELEKEEDTEVAEYQRPSREDVRDSPPSPQSSPQSSQMKRKK